MFVSFTIGLTLLAVGAESSELAGLPQLISKWTHSHSDHWTPRDLIKSTGFANIAFMKTEAQPQPQSLPVEFSTFEQQSFAQKNQAVADMVDTGKNHLTFFHPYHIHHL